MHLMIRAPSPLTHAKTTWVGVMPRQAAAALTRASTGPFENVIGLSEGRMFEREREGMRDREGTGKRGRMYARLLYASACQG